MITNNGHVTHKIPYILKIRELDDGVSSSLRHFGLSTTNGFHTKCGSTNNSILIYLLQRHSNHMLPHSLSFLMLMVISISTDVDLITIIVM